MFRDFGLELVELVAVQLEVLGYPAFDFADFALKQEETRLQIGQILLVLSAFGRRGDVRIGCFAL